MPAASPTSTPSGRAPLAAVSSGIDAAGQGSAVLTGLNDPQGLDLDGAGNLVLAEGGAGRIAVDVRSCLPLMLGGAGVTLKVGGPAQAISLGTDCVAGQPSFSLAPGARWPAPPGTVWPAGNLTTLTLDNGARAALESVSGAALLLLQPPAQGSSGTATVAVQMHLGQQVGLGAGAGDGRAVNTARVYRTRMGPSHDGYDSGGKWRLLAGER